MPFFLWASIPSFTGPPCPANAHLKVQLRSSLLPKLLSSHPTQTHTLLVPARPNVFSVSLWKQAGHRAKKPWRETASQDSQRRGLRGAVIVQRRDSTEIFTIESGSQFSLSQGRSFWPAPRLHSKPGHESHSALSSYSPTGEAPSPAQPCAPTPARCQHVSAFWPERLESSLNLARSVWPSGVSFPSYKSKKGAVVLSPQGSQEFHRYE